MTNAQHTPGPWKCADDEGFINPVVETADSKQYICVMEGRGRKKVTHLANARLIAAAPRMYEALLGLLDLLDNDNEQPYDKRVAAAREIVAKAEGK